MWGNNSSNTALSAYPANGGLGFQDWTSAEQGTSESSGYFTGDSTEYSGGNINSSDNLCWGMYGSSNGGGVARAYRKTINPLEIGSTLRARITIQYRNGFKGAGFFANGEDVFMFQAAGDEYQYSTNGGSSWTTISPEWPYGSGQSVFEIVAARTGATNHEYRVTQVNTGNTVLVQRSSNNPVNEMQFFVGGTDGAGPSNLYLNFLSAYNPFRL